jgi:hypothetical protein
MQVNFVVTLDDPDDSTMHVDPEVDAPTHGVIHAHRALGPEPRFDPAEEGDPAYKCKMPTGGKIYVRESNVKSVKPATQGDGGEVYVL